MSSGVRHHALEDTIDLSEELVEVPAIAWVSRMIQRIANRISSTRPDAESTL